MRSLLMLFVILVSCVVLLTKPHTATVIAPDRTGSKHAWAEVPDFSPFKEEKQYGNCTVTTNTIIIGGMQTLYCRELEAEPSFLTPPPTTKREALNALLEGAKKALKVPVEISISHYAPGYIITFSPHGHERGKSHTKNGLPVPVTIQIYTGKVIWREVIPRSDVEMLDHQAIIRLASDDDLALRLLDELARGQRLTFKVGSKSGSIPLNGSKAAIADFRQRAGLQESHP